MLLVFNSADFFFSFDTFFIMTQASSYYPRLPCARSYFMLLTWVTLCLPATHTEPLAIFSSAGYLSHTGTTDTTWSHSLALNSCFLPLKSSEWNSAWCWERECEAGQVNMPGLKRERGLLLFRETETANNSSTLWWTIVASHTHTFVFLRCLTIHMWCIHIVYIQLPI